MLLLSTVAYADETEEPKVIYKQKTEIDFEGVEGFANSQATGLLILDRKHAKFNPMIKLRTDLMTK